MKQGVRKYRGEEVQKKQGADERRWLESERKFQLLADIMPQMIWTSNTEGNLDYLSRAVNDFTGLPDEELRRGAWLNIIHPEDITTHLESWNHALDTGEDFTCEHRVRRHDGEYRWMLSRATAQRDEYGTPLMWVGTSTDIHDQKTMASELEKRVEQSTKELRKANEELARNNTELSSFSYVASHDLQEPLRKIRAFSARILDTDGKNLSEAGQEYFRRIQRSSRRMQALINDLLAYSRLRSGEQVFHLTDLTSLMEDVKSELKELIEEKKAIIEYTYLPALRVIPFQFAQLFTNLIGNSLKFSREGIPPRISIETEKVKGQVIAAHPALPDKTYIKFTFSDNGIGFDEKYSDLIFQVFQRLHSKNEYSGTGIGLAICKKIIENHEGFIHATGEPGHGATFTFYVPLL